MAKFLNDINARTFWKKILPEAENFIVFNALSQNQTLVTMGVLLPYWPVLASLGARQ